MLDVYDEEEDGAQISEKMMMKTDKQKNLCSFFTNIDNFALV